jgi:hypothetical protein
MRPDKPAESGFGRPDHRRDAGVRKRSTPPKAVVTRIGRLARSVADLQDIVRTVKAQGAS